MRADRQYGPCKGEGGANMAMRWIGLAAVLLAGACPAAVAAQDFMTCDGYDPPKSKGDGMTTNAVLWGLAPGNADMRQVRIALANRLRLRLDNSLTAHLALLRQRAVRDPSALINYFIIALSSEKFAEVAAVGGSLTFDLPSSRGGWTVQGDDSLRYELIADRAEIAGAFAYALVVTGKPERAAAVIARAREELTEAMVPPPPPD